MAVISSLMEVSWCAATGLTVDQYALLENVIMLKKNGAVLQAYGRLKAGASQNVEKQTALAEEIVNTAFVTLTQKNGVIRMVTGLMKTIVTAVFAVLKIQAADALVKMAIVIHHIINIVKMAGGYLILIIATQTVVK